MTSECKHLIVDLIMGQYEEENSWGKKRIFPYLLSNQELGRLVFEN